MYIKTIKGVMMEKKIGRPKQTVKRNIEVKFLVTEEENARLEALAEKIGINKSKMIRNILLGEIGTYEMLTNIKVIPIVKEALAALKKINGEDDFMDKLL